MNLTDESVFFYLLDKKVLSEKQLVNGNTMVIPSHTRNTIFRVLNTVGDKKFIVKQTSVTEEQYYRLSKNESYVYNMIYNLKEYAPLRPYMPEMVHYDAQRNIIIIEFLSDTTSVHEYYYSKKEFEPEIARAEALMLSMFHFTVPPNIDTTHFSKQLPWVLRIIDWKPADAFPGEPLKTQFISHIIENAELKRLLVQLRSEWEVKSLMHGDVKWTNFIINTKEPLTKQYIIDWETCDIGDPAWDVGGLLQSYFSIWIFSQQQQANNPSAPANTYDTIKMQNSIIAFWSDYVRNLNFTDMEAWQFLVKATRYSAARLIQTSIEALHKVTEISPNHYWCIQAAQNILTDPFKAINLLFGSKNYNQ